MPKLRVLKSSRIKDIPTKNPYKYAEQVMPIYEIHRILRSEMVELSCRSTHCIKARSTKVHENDNLYELFRKFTNKDVKFIQQWLKLFTISNQRNLEVRASRYLASKGLAFDNWTSITDGMQGDILVLYTLCMLFDKHAIVHLRHGMMWSTLADLSQDHHANIQKCELHLCYVGRGLFAELIERKTPLEIVKDTEAVQSLIIGELSTTEEQTIRLIETAGLGTAISKEHDTQTTTVSSTRPNIVSLPSTPKPSTSAQMMDRYVKLNLVKLDIKPGDRITVSDNLLASIPVSKYAAPKSVSSENTIDYSPADEEEQRRLLQTSRPLTTPTVTKNVKQRTFSMSTHGIR